MNGVICRYHFRVLALFKYPIVDDFLYGVWDWDMGKAPMRTLL